MQVFMKFRKMPWASLAVFESRKDALLTKTFLQSHGFETRGCNNRLLQFLLFLGPPRTTFRVQVRLNNLVQAMNFLNANPSTQQILRCAMYCPFCASFDVKYPRLVRKFFLPTLFSHLGIISRVFGHEAHCENCHFIWQLPGDRISAAGNTVAMEDK